VLRRHERTVKLSAVRIRGTRRSVAVGGAVVALLVATSCINFAPAVGTPASAVEAARSVDAVFADVTGDGSDDVIVGVALPGSDALVRMVPCGGGCLQAHEEIPVGAEVRELAPADVDGDGVTDVAVVTSVDARVYFGGAATPPRPEGLVADEFVAVEPGFGPWTRVVAGDFDDDGDADLGVGSSSGYEFVAGDGNRGFAPPAIGTIGPSSAIYGGLAAGDVDGDGDLEVLVTVSGLGVSDFFSSVLVFRDGTSPAPGYHQAGPAWSGFFDEVTAGDLDGDGIDDVAFVRTVSPPFDIHDVFLLRSTGNGFTGFGAEGALTSLPVRAVDMELRDIDLDRNVDFLASDGTRLSWWHGFGNGSLVARVDRSAGPGPDRLASGAVGAGPGPDLVVTNPGAPFAPVSYLTNTSQL
jgi:hypothetical protein